MAVAASLRTHSADLLLEDHVAAPFVCSWQKTLVADVLVTLGVVVVCDLLALSMC